MKRLVIAALCALSSFAMGEEDPTPDAKSASSPAASRRLLVRKQKELEALQNEVLKLGGTIDHPTRVRVSVWAIELDRTRLKELKLPNPFHVAQTSLVPSAEARFPSTEANAIGTSHVSEEQLLQAVEPLVAKGIVRIKASPSVVISLGQSTSIECFREPTQRVRDDQKSPGVSITVLPRQASEGRILLELQLRIVQDDVDNSITHNGTIIPGVSSRRIQTRGELKLDEPFLLGGLIQTRHSPDDANLTSETEFIVVTTTNVISPGGTILPKD